MAQPIDKIRGELLGISSFLPSCGFQGLNPSHQHWWQASSPIKPSYPLVQNILIPTLPTSSHLVFCVNRSMRFLFSSLCVTLHLFKRKRLPSHVALVRGRAHYKMYSA